MGPAIFKGPGLNACKLLLVKLASYDLTALLFAMPGEQQWALIT